MRLAFSLAVCLALVTPLVSVNGCARTPGSISLSRDWPVEPDSYKRAYRDWTRHGRLRSDYQQVLDVYATFKSPAFRSAYAARKARNANLSADEANALQGAEQAASAGAYEIQLLVTTWDYRENDLHKGPSSLWRVALNDDQGNEVVAESIVRDRRPTRMLRSEYPDMGDFAIAYVARFPRTVELLRDDATRFTLRLSSARGAVMLTWRGTGQTRARGEDGQ